MPTNKPGTLLKPLLAVVIVVMIGVAGYAIIRLGNLTRLDDSYRLDLSQHLQIPAEQIGYRQAGELPLDVGTPRAISVGPEDHIYVATEEAICVLSSQGELVNSLPISAPPTCLAVAGEGHSGGSRIYVGVAGGIHVLSPAGELILVSDAMGEKSQPTALALGVEDVFVADAAQRVIWRIGIDGKVLGRIGDSSGGERGPGFIIPSPYFDLVCGSEGLLHAVNPGTRRIETYSYEGVLQSVWGRAGSNLTGFFGCCNPAHLAQLPDGRFVTSEKGIPRIKVFDENGVFDCAVAGPNELDVPLAALGDPRMTDRKSVFDIAADSQGRVLVLDPARKSVRVFVQDTKESAAEDVTG
jgi:hypothetical protein